jgi:hypothetical protein
MMVKKAAPLEEATPVTLVISQMRPGAPILANFDEMAAKVAEFVEVYRNLEVTEEYVPQAKKDRAYLNSFQKALDARRLEVKREYMAPVAAFESEVAKLTAPIKEASESIDRQVKEYEERARVAKREECRKHYAEFAGALITAVPFERIEDPSWSLKSTSLMAAFEAIEERAEKIARDDATIDDLNLSHPVEAHAEYFATLDMARAIARSKALDEQERIALDMEARKAEAAAERAKPIPPVEAAPKPAPVAEAEEAVTWHIVVTCTESQKDALIDALKALDIPGTVRRG